MTRTPVHPHAPASAASIARGLLRDKHFLIASVILAVAAAGWGAAVNLLKLTTLKRPVPWPAAVKVNNSVDFRLISLADEFGPFKKVQPNDEIMKGLPEGHRDGEIVLSKEIMESLKIGTGVDSKRFSDRSCNWYVSRLYRDTRPQASVRLWQVDVFYYTGEADTVPHIPEICGGAAGQRVLQSDRVTVSVPEAGPGWAKTVPLMRTRLQDREGRQSVAYYMFSMNGVFSESRSWVRWELLWPFMRYAYFAKIQFSRSVMDSEETDRSAEEFLRYALPEVLKALPTSADVQALEKSG